MPVYYPLKTCGLYKWGGLRVQRALKVICRFTDDESLIAKLNLLLLSFFQKCRSWLFRSRLESVNLHFNRFPSMLITWFMDQTLSSKTLFITSLLYFSEVSAWMSPATRKSLFLKHIFCIGKDIFVSHPANIFEYVIIIK